MFSVLICNNKKGEDNWKLVPKDLVKLRFALRVFRHA